MNIAAGNSSILKTILIGAGLFIIIFGLKMSASFASPILLALIIGISVAPLPTWIARKGAPIWLALSITVIVVFLAVVGLIVLLGLSASNLVMTLPKYQDNLQSQIEAAQTALQGLGLDQVQISDSLGLNEPSKILGYLGSFLSGILGSLSTLTVMLMVLLFFILGMPLYYSKMKYSFASSNPAMIRIREVIRDLRQYVVITTWINFLVALINVVLLVILGVDFPILWGILAFLTGYIPNVGFWIALIPPFILAFLEFGAGKALIVLVGYIVINGGIQDFIQPRMMGVGLNLSPFVVVLSLFFWGWILGPMGALLAVPLTIIVKEVFLDAYDDSRVLAELMTADAPKPIAEADVSSP